MTAGDRRKVDAALDAHGRWVAHLREAIRTGKSDLRAESVARDNQCELGKWLNGTLREAGELAVFPATARSSPLYTEICEAHAAFHLKAADVLRMATAGDRAGALRALDKGGALALASSALVLKLVVLKARH